MLAPRQKHTGLEVDLTLFKPIVRAYALGYLSSIGPRLLGFLRYLRRKDRSTSEKLDLLYVILRTSTQFNRFPTSCAIIVGGATALPRLANTVFGAVLRAAGAGTSVLSSERYFARLGFVCTFFSALLAFNLLNRDDGWTRKRAQSRSLAGVDRAIFNSPNQHHLPPPYHPNYAGKTIDFTLFALLRALDVVAIRTWIRTRSRSWHPEQRAPSLANFLRKTADPAIFATSAAIIMWSWFYSPHRLPRAYNHWINTAAAIDPRLIETLRLARQGDFVYGQDTGQAELIGSMCRDMHLPEELGDPTKTIPIPCEIVHMGTGPSCELHAMSRFWRSWRFAMEMYLPLQLIIRLRSPNVQSLISAISGAARSSAFLGAFVAFFYYGVCLSRTRLGPKLFSRTTVTPQMWDSGLCVLAGCMACGWPILIERPSRRQEIAFFVAPRALATLLPRVYDKKYKSREQIVFAASVAVVMNAVSTGNSRNVRGVFGKLLEQVLE